MVIGETFIKKIITLLLCGHLLFSTNSIFAEIIGTPPYKTIEIITTPTANHFDMVQDENNFIYVVYNKGIKVYNGVEWQIIEIPVPRSLRSLFYDKSGKIYFGGWDVIGYIEKDQYGGFQFTILDPKNSEGRIEDIWNIETCNNEIYFQGVHHVSRYNPLTQKFRNWNFNSKLGAITCLNDIPLLQDREKGLLELHTDNWVESKTKLENNSVIYEFKKSAHNNSLFILSESEKWQFIKDKKIYTLNFDKQLPNLDNYVSIEYLFEDEFVLGSNNGLLTFIDIKTKRAESFQIANEWIAKIIKTRDNGLLVLTEFEIFYIDWPSPIRVQGRQSGLASNVLDISLWNDKLYVSSSAGVFLEEKNQLIYQHKIFKRLNWTNKEAWKLLPINDKQALLAESHKIYLIENTSDGTVSSETITPITNIIYPRKLIQSQFNKDLFYIFTEFDVQILIRNNTNKWKLHKILNHRATSLIEQDSSTLLIATEESGLFKVKIRASDYKPVKKDNVSELYGLSQEKGMFLKIFKSIDGTIFAFNEEDLFTIENNQLINTSIFNLKKVIKDNNILSLKQMPSGLLYGNTYSKVFYQTDTNQWKFINLSPYIRGSITTIFANDQGIKAGANGTIINFDNKYKVQQKPSPFNLIFTKITFTEKAKSQNLPLNSENILSYIQGSGDLSFSYVLTDIKNQDKAKYRYRLSGDNKSWQAYADKTHVSFINLPAGDYEFEVQAKDYLGKVYTNKPYKFIVRPLWYLTVIAKLVWLLLLIAVFLFLFGKYFKWREKVHIAQKLALKKVIFSKTIELKKLNFSLQKMAHQDGLTGLSNRMYLDDFIKSLLDKNINKITVIMMDMDYFKVYNDLNGHLAGDELLKELAGYLKIEFNKEEQIVARYGGEEFVVILVDSTLDYAKNKTENIRALIDNKANQTSISAGISESKATTNLKNSEAIYLLIDQADKALYHAKDKGRNRIEIYSD